MSCPKCGGLMKKKGKGTDHNLRVENRNVLKVKHGKTLVTQATRPLMCVCEKCGYIEFYIPTEFGKAIRKQGKDATTGRSKRDNNHYFT